jgi:hypothetical protein
VADADMLTEWLRDLGEEKMINTAPAVIIGLRDDPGRPSLASVQEEIGQLELIRRIELPTNLFDRASAHESERYRRRVAVEAHPRAAPPLRPDAAD